LWLFALLAADELASLLGYFAGLPSAFCREVVGRLGEGIGISTVRYFFDPKLRYFALVQRPLPKARDVDIQGSRVTQSELLVIDWDYYDS
jgi:hypothetical protein